MNNCDPLAMSTVVIEERDTKQIVKSTCDQKNCEVKCESMKIKEMLLKNNIKKGHKNYLRRYRSIP